MEIKGIVKEWVKFADMDFQASKTLMNHFPQPFEIICYHCQQSAEKYLKAFLISQNQEAPRTHDLIKLRKMCETFDEDFQRIKMETIDLTNYGVLPRYPFEIEILETDAKLAMKEAETIKEFIKQKLMEYFNPDVQD